MTDKEKCRMIAELEHGHPVELVAGPQIHCSTCRMFYRLVSGGDYQYPTDLNATMRAARKLPSHLDLMVRSSGAAWIRTISGDISCRVERDGDPADAAFEALSSWLAAKDGRPE